MKLRIRGNSLRLRLSKLEVETFAKNGSITDEICFGISQADKLIYSVEKSLDKNVNAIFQNGKITLFVPGNIAKNWVETDEVGFAAEQIIDNEAILRILVEKDFVCLNPRENEDESDNYSHPNHEKSF
jgi:hypothetical protein